MSDKHYIIALEEHYADPEVSATFRGLDAARKLYEAYGFALAEEWPGRQWGKQMFEQRFVRPARAPT